MKFELNGVSLDLTKETVQSMLKKFDIPNNRRFKPEIGDNYWYIDNSGRKNNTPHDMHRFDLARIARNNCYRSEEEAEKADQIKELGLRAVKLRPNVGESYHYISEIGDVEEWAWAGSDTDIYIWNAGNGFFNGPKPSKSPMVKPKKEVASETNNA